MYEIPAIIGTVAAVVAATWIPKQIERTKQFNAAAEPFRNVFNEAIRDIESGDCSDRMILQQEFLRHDDAMRKFVHYLRGRDLKRFNETWNKYQQWYKERVDVSILELIGSEALDINRLSDPAHIAEVSRMRNQQLLKHIQNVLKFAQHK